ncbi:RHS repeat-associated core domain-containing protein [Eubacteriales bacterium OttesenSCG-928-N14]|nr:RHS repeat-associated core domain-containing protein [Eubacteriales bacterium OttesenSCG-928-N14]
MEYTYDNRGSQSTATEYDTSGPVDALIKSVEYQYDLGNNLKSVTESENSQDEILSHSMYTNSGQRIRQILSSETDQMHINYLYMGLQMVASYDDDLMTYELNIVGSAVIADKVFGDTNEEYKFYLYDIRGSVTGIVDSNGSQVKGYEYDEFGNTEERGDDELHNSIAYTGGVYDSTTNLYYLNARHYDPNTGRFLQQDTYRGSASAQWTQHLYAYTGNNPVMMVDPTGHAPVSTGRGLRVPTPGGSFVNPVPYKEKKPKGTGTKREGTGYSYENNDDEVVFEFNVFFEETDEVSEEWVRMQYEKIVSEFNRTAKDGREIRMIVNINHMGKNNATLEVYLREGMGKYDPGYSSGTSKKGEMTITIFNLNDDNAGGILFEETEHLIGFEMEGYDLGSANYGAYWKRNQQAWQMAYPSTYKEIVNGGGSNTKIYPNKQLYIDDATVDAMIYFMENPSLYNDFLDRNPNWFNGYDPYDHYGLGGY